MLGTKATAIQPPFIFVYKNIQGGHFDSVRNPCGMAIYGTALLSFCLLAGLLAGKLLGWMLGMEGNIGGVGIAMLLLILLTDRLRKGGSLAEPSEAGILFWSSIYIPVIVAMAASQNVRAAIHGGPAALIAGVLATAACCALVPVFARMGRSPDESPPPSR
jgi:malonate transporter MadL subunit